MTPASPLGLSNWPAPAPSTEPDTEQVINKCLSTAWRTDLSSARENVCHRLPTLVLLVHVAAGQLVRSLLGVCVCVCVCVCVYSKFDLPTIVQWFPSLAAR